MTESDSNVVVVLLSTADYESDVWTNKQHLGSRLAESFDVIYVNSMGLREPRLNLADFRRVLHVLTRRDRATNRRPVPRRMSIVSPSILPFHRFSGVRRLNRLLLNRQIRKILSGRRYVLWSFSPLTYGLEELSDKTIYHSVDLLHTFPGVPSGIVIQEERGLIRSADEVIASSEGVRSHLRAQGRANVRLWENVADTERFAASARAVGTGRLDRVIFAGNLTPVKIDLPLMIEVAKSGVPIAVAGPMSIDGQDSTAISSLFSHENVEYLGNLELDELALEISRSKVGLIPYLLNEHTSGVFPMKVFEYLSAGCSVVSTSLPSLGSGEQITGLEVAGASRFPHAVIDLLLGWNVERASAVQAAAMPHSWTSRAMEAVEVVRNRSTD